MPKPHTVKPVTGDRSTPIGMSRPHTVKPVTGAHLLACLNCIYLHQFVLKHRHDPAMRGRTPVMWSYFLSISLSHVTLYHTIP